MSFKVRIEVDDACDEEIIIRCKSMTEDVLRLQTLITNTECGEIELELGGQIHFVEIPKILFFESADGKTTAHTDSRMYYTDKKLYELESILPKSFLRISKSCIINIKAVSSIRRDLTGIGEAYFSNTVKKVYISRGYYKQFRERINEMRLKQ